MKLIKCDGCGNHRDPYAELIIISDPHPTPHMDLCEQCVERIKQFNMQADEVRARSLPPSKAFLVP